MQSKILEFEIDGKGSAVLFADFSSLRPFMINGVAHAFLNGSNVVVTLYSETGISTNSSLVCSADVRVSLDASSLRGIIDQLSAINSAFFVAEEELALQGGVATEPAETRTQQEEILGPPL